MSFVQLYFKLFRVTIPINFNYWKNVGLFDDMFECWCIEYNATPEECTNIENKRFKEFLNLRTLCILKFGNDVTMPPHF